MYYLFFLSVRKIPSPISTTSLLTHRLTRLRLTNWLNHPFFSRSRSHLFFYQIYFLLIFASFLTWMPSAFSFLYFSFFFLSNFLSTWYSSLLYDFTFFQCATFIILLVTWPIIILHFCCCFSCLPLYISSQKHIHEYATFNNTAKNLSPLPLTIIHPHQGSHLPSPSPHTSSIIHNIHLPHHHGPSSHSYYIHHPIIIILIYQ